MDIGKKVRELRFEKGLTLKQVADKSGITPSALSQIERGIANPSVSSLKAISDALGVTIGHLFNLDSCKRSILVHKKDRKILSPSPGITYYLLTSNLGGKIQFIFSEYDVGVSTGDKLYSHEGEECALILQGKMELKLGEEVYILTKEDSIRFECSIPHRITNIGKTKLKCIWAITPPSF